MRNIKIRKNRPRCDHKRTVTILLDEGEIQEDMIIMGKIYKVITKLGRHEIQFCLRCHCLWGIRDKNGNKMADTVIFDAPEKLISTVKKTIKNQKKLLSNYKK